MSLICHERQVKKAESEKVQLILCWRAKENIITEELAKNRDQICSIQKSSYVPWIIEMVCSYFYLRTRVEGEKEKKKKAKLIQFHLVPWNNIDAIVINV